MSRPDRRTDAHGTHVAFDQSAPANASVKARADNVDGRAVAANFHSDRRMLGEELRQHPAQ